MIHPVHKPLYYGKKRYCYEKGGRGSSKSFSVTDYALRVTYDHNRVLLFLRYTFETAKISILSEFEEAMKREGAENDFNIVGREITNKFTGSKIIFKGVKTSSSNQTASLKSIQGLTDVIYDEFEEHPDKESFDKLDDSIRTVGAVNRIVLVSNALHKQSWQYIHFWTPEGLYYPMTDHILTDFTHNYYNLSESWHQKRRRVKEVNPAQYDREYLGLDYEDIEGALWQSSWIKRIDIAPELKKIAIAIDPAVTSNQNSDETGIIGAGIGYDGNYYVISDKSGKYTPNGWANKAVTEYDELSANVIIGEVNQGGDMVETTVKNIDNTVAYQGVRASRGKAIRAEPISSLYEEGKVFHVGTFRALEIELTTWIPGVSNFSPNRLDALVWCLTGLIGKQIEAFAE